ncbi:HMG box domain-containing protein [Mycena chlorophos]|uniref:HMG box domain-containing protein n=1 Tax=Mycena chlorophos TaxID=658473 RepID=A0A8H6SC16_MYCCL|nr:HMG box domain-containing protein [Mycena chlorophos]
MPVERTRGSRRTVADGDALVWTQPETGPGIAFATNLTPTTFVVEEQQPQQSFFILEPSPSLSLAVSPKRRRTASAPTPASAPAAGTLAAELSGLPPLVDAPPAQQQPRIPRPPNAFILFRASFVKAGTVPAQAESSHAALSSIAGLTWAQLPPAQKAVWYELAKEKREEHARRFPGYVFRQTGTGDKERKPRVRVKSRRKGVDDADGDGGGVQSKRRDVPPADREREAHIAELLIAGFHGRGLAEGVEEYDRTRGKKAGTEIRFGIVETPEDRRRAEAEAEAGTKTRKTSKAPKRKSTSRSASAPSTPGPFDFEFEFGSGPASPVDTVPDTDSTPPSSPVGCSPYDWSFDLDAFTSNPSTAPASPALSFASSSSSSSISRSSSLASLSSASSFEDLSLAQPPVQVQGHDPLLGLDLGGLGMGFEYDCFAEPQPCAGAGGVDGFGIDLDLDLGLALHDFGAYEQVHDGTVSMAQLDLRLAPSTVQAW